MRERCETCSYWSEMLAQVNGAHVEAICLKKGSPKHLRYVPGHSSCALHERGEAIDSPRNLRASSP